MATGRYPTGDHFLGDLGVDTEVTSDTSAMPETAGGAAVLAFASNTAWAQASKERVAHLFEESLRICLSCRDSPDMRRQPSRKQASELKVLMESGIRSAQRTPAALTLLRYLRVCAGATPSISVRIRGKAARAAPTIVRCAHR